MHKSQLDINLSQFLQPAKTKSGIISEICGRNKIDYPQYIKTKKRFLFPDFLNRTFSIHTTMNILAN